MNSKATAARRRVKVPKTTGIYLRTTSTGDKRYEYAYVDSDGKQRWKTVRTKQEVLDGREEVRSKIRGGERVVPSSVTFGEYADGWLAKQTKIRPTTRKLYETYLRVHLTPRFGRRLMQAITVDDVAAMIGELGQGIRYEVRDGLTAKVEGKPLSGWTIRGILVVLGRLFGSAVRSGVVTSNPVRRLEKRERPTSSVGSSRRST